MSGPDFRVLFVDRARWQIWELLDDQNSSTAAWCISQFLKTCLGRQPPTWVRGWFRSVGATLWMNGATDETGDLVPKTWATRRASSVLEGGSGIRLKCLLLCPCWVHITQLFWITHETCGRQVSPSVGVLNGWSGITTGTGTPWDVGRSLEWCHWSMWVNMPSMECLGACASLQCSKPYKFVGSQSEPRVFL